jgi:hypothetical protein
MNCRLDGEAYACNQARSEGSCGKTYLASHRARSSLTRVTEAILSCLEQDARAGEILHGEPDHPHSGP